MHFDSSAQAVDISDKLDRSRPEIQTTNDNLPSDFRELTVNSPKSLQQEGFRFFHPEGLPISLDNFPVPEMPLKVVVLTSIRDIGNEDSVGRFVPYRNEESSHSTQEYMKGAVESLLEKSFGNLGQYIQLAGIIVDDVPDQDGVESKGYKIDPNDSSVGTWILDADRKLPSGQSIADITHHIPSTFRKLPLKLNDERSGLKQIFELRLEQACKDLKADIILSDHLLLKLEHLHKNDFRGRVINIHPGITLSGDPDICRGLTPTADTLIRAKEASGQRIKTGASLHFVADEIDGGGVICDAKRTIVSPEWDPATLRFNNYQSSKLPALEFGLMYFAANLRVFDKANAH
jgi:folate-dependent phosphoribosylglycinamide formyltransferase PurN